MLEIFILFKLGRAINRKATSKGWPGWLFVLILICMYICCAISGVVAMVLLSNANGNDDDGPFEFLIGYALGAVTGALTSYFLVLILPDRSEPEDEYEGSRRSRNSDADYDDGPRPRRIRDEVEEDRDIPRARRAEDNDDWRRR